MAKIIIIFRYLFFCSISVEIFVAQIEDLNLDNCRATQIVGLTDEYVNLTSLSLINVGLTTLKGFPNLPALKKVIFFFFI